MKKIIKSIFCILLSTMFVFSGASITAYAKSAQATPVILVHGLGAQKVYENPGTENAREVGNFDFSGIMNYPALIDEILNLVGKGCEVNTDRLIKNLANVTKTMEVNCDSNGNTPSNVGVEYWTDPLSNHPEYYQNAQANEAAIARQLCDAVGSHNVYYFSYDWRLDICETAEKLNSYIDNVKKYRNVNKVTLVGCSLGGSVLSAYIDAHANKNDIERCVFVNPAYMGVDYARPYAKDVVFEAKRIREFLYSYSENGDAGANSTLINIIGGLFDENIDTASEKLSKILQDEAVVNRIYLEVIKPVIGNVASLWECIPYDCFDKAVSEMSKIGFLDTNSGLYTKITKYHAVQGRVKKNLKALKKKGVQVAIVANYGVSGIPITSKSSNHTDILIDTKYASCGATVAQYGKKLKASGKYVSKDKIINAKTCALPDNTWFIKNLTHMNFKYGSQATRLVARLATSKAQSSIKVMKKKYKYSQFMVADRNQNLKAVK